MSGEWNPGGARRAVEFQEPSRQPRRSLRPPRREDRIREAAQGDFLGCIAPETGITETSLYRFLNAWSAAPSEAEVRMFRRLRRAKPPLRYFLYISDTKLNMLFEQIDPAQRRRISAEAMVDFKLASLTLRRADVPSAARLAKLQVVERYIDKHHHVGTIQEPGCEYFRGTMPLQWGWLHLGRAPSRDTVFFRGQDGSHVVVLAGSRRHVLGEQQPTDEVRTNSATPNILAVIAEHISGNPELAQEWHRLRSIDPSTAGSEMVSAAHDPPEIGLREAAKVRLYGPAQYLDFLAVPIISGPVTIESEEVHATLATPLSVAVARNQ